MILNQELFDCRHAIGLEITSVNFKSQLTCKSNVMGFTRALFTKKVYNYNNSVAVFTTWGSGQALKLDEPSYFCGVDLCGDLA